MSNVYLAMYKGKGNWVDSLIRFFTGKPYSHCEIFIKSTMLDDVFGLDWERKRIIRPCYQAYSASPRNGGVRMKEISLPTITVDCTYDGQFNPENWDLIPLKNVKCEQINALYQRTKGKKYDFLGAIGCVLPLREKPSRYYCSEWCYEAIFGKKPEKALSPNLLAQIVSKHSTISTART